MTGCSIIGSLCGYIVMMTIIKNKNKIDDAKKEVKKNGRKR